MRTSIVVLAALTSVPLRSGVAQGRIVLAPATHIRYSLAPNDRLVDAEVVVQRGESVWVHPLGTGRTLVVALPALARLDVSQGRDRQTLRGTGIGMLVGVTIGVAGGYYAGTDCPQSYCQTRNQKMRNLAISFGVIGSGIGAIVGATHHTDRWVPVPLTISEGTGSHPARR